MKLIAAKDFFNSKSLRITLDKKDPLHRHDNMIHKGARFSIGTAESYKDLGPQEQEHVGTLLKHGCVVFDSRENEENGVTKRIDAEAKQENEAHQAALKPRKSQSELIAAAVAEALASAVVISNKPGKA